MEKTTSIFNLPTKIVVWLIHFGCVISLVQSFALANLLQLLQGNVLLSVAMPVVSLCLWCIALLFTENSSKKYFWLLIGAFALRVTVSVIVMGVVSPEMFAMLSLFLGSLVQPILLCLVVFLTKKEGTNIYKRLK